VSSGTVAKPPVKDLRRVRDGGYLPDPADKFWYVVPGI